MKKAAPFLLLLGAFAALRPAALAQSTSGVKFAFYPQGNTSSPAQVQHPELLFPASAGEEEPREVCANAEGIAWVTITDPPTVAVYSQFGYALKSGVDSSFLGGVNQLPFTFQIPRNGQVVKVTRLYQLSAQLLIERDDWLFYSPLPPIISGFASPLPDCNTASGSIAVSDASANSPDIRRTFRLFSESGVLLQSATLKAGNYTFTGLAPGSYRVEIATGCETADAYFTVASPSLNAQIFGPASVCAGTPVTLTAGGGGTYSWNTGAGSSSIQLTPAQAGAVTYSVTVSNGYCSAVKSHTVNVLPLPAAAVQGPGEVCANTDFTLTAGGGVQYAWSTGQTGASLPGRITAPATYTVTVTDQNGCQNTVSKTVAPYPVPKISGIGRVCQGGGVYLVVTNAGIAFQWSTGATSAGVTVYPSATTDYTVTVTDAQHCTTVLSHRVVVDVPSGVQITGPTSICLGDTVTLGGYGSYDNQWSTGERWVSQIRVSPTQSTTYTLTGKDPGNHCTGTATHQIIVSPRPDVGLIGPGGICSGQQATLTVNDWSGSANGELSYQWSTGAFTPSITVAPVSTQTITQLYSVTVTNAGGCSTVLSKNLTVNPGVTATVTPAQTICAGDSALLTAAGGAAYRWSTGATTASIWAKPASSTVYSVTVTNSSGCSGSAQTTVSVNTPPLLTIQGPSKLCAGQTATLTAGGGSTYVWNTGAATASISVSPQQTASYTVTSGPAGCSVSRTHTIEVEPLPSGAIEGPARICAGQAATLTASGGVSYRWSAGNAAGASITVSPAASSTYTVTITNAQGCSVVRTHALQVGMAGSAGNDGPLTCLKNSVKLFAIAPEPGAQLQWKNPSGVAFAQGDTATVTQPGIYTLLITAADGCTRTATTQVTEMRTAPQAAISVSGPLSCIQTQATLSVQTPEPGYSYQWTNSAGALLASASSVTVSTPGAYTLQVTGANGCAATFSAMVRTDSASTAAPDLSVLTDTLTCVKTGVTIRAISSTPGLSFQWRNASGTVIGTSHLLTVNTPGTYEVQATTANGCKASAYAVVGRSNTPPNIAISPANSGYFECDKEILLNGSSTTPGVVYEWRNPIGRIVSNRPSFSTNIAGTYTLKITAPNGCSSNASTTISQLGIPYYNPYNGSTIYDNLDFSLTYYYKNWSNFQQYNLPCNSYWGSYLSFSLTAEGPLTEETLTWRLTYPNGSSSWPVSGQYYNFSFDQPGTYFLTLTSSSGCKRTKEILVTLPEPAISGNLSVCSGQGATLTASAGSAYQWSTGATSRSINTGPLTSNTTYSVTVTNYNGCSSSKSVTVVVNPPITVNAGGNQTLCQGSSILLNGSAQGGTGPYNFAWSNQTYAPSTQVSPLASTSYTLTVTDSKGCSGSASVAVSVKPPPAAAVQVSASVLCAGQRATLVASGGVSYRWSTGQTTASITVSPASTATYTVTVTGSNNCTAVVSKTIQVHAPPIALLQGPGTACTGTQAALQVLPQSGGSAFTYAWNTGASTPGISTAPVAAPALYTVTVTNEWGCTESLSKMVSPLAAPEVHLSGDSAICAGQTAALAAVSNVPVFFSWSTGIVQASATSALLSVEPSGPETYSVTAVDANGCRDSASWFLQVHPAPAPAIFVKAPNCFGQPARLSAEGGASYLWSTGETSESISPAPLQEHTYSVTATSAQGCSAPAEVRIAPPPPLTLSYTLRHTDDCIPGNAALIPAVQGAQGAVSYSIRRNGATEWNPTLTGLSAGAYTLQAVDAKGCRAEVEVEVVEKRPPALSPLPDDTLSCAQRSVYLFANAEVSGLWYEWSTESGTVLSSSDSVQIDFPGIYYLHASDEAGCTATDTFQIHTLIPLGLSFDTIPATHCDSANAQLKVRAAVPGKWLYRLDPAAPWDSTGVFERILPGLYQVYAASGDSSCIVDTLIQVPSKEICIELCAGDSVLIGRPDIAAWCVKWLPEDGLADPASPVTWAKPSANGRYILYQADDDGNLLDSLAYKITMCPALMVTPARLNLCEQENATLTAAGGQGPYIWKDESGAIVAEGATFTPAVPGVYTVTQADGTGPASKAVVEVTRDIAEGLIGILASDDQLCADSVRLSSLGSARNLEWKSRAGTVLASGNGFVVREAGEYTLQGILGAGCIAEAAVRISPAQFAISINTPADTFDMSVYRPASGFYHRISGTGNQTLSLRGPEGKPVLVDINKGCFDCGTVTIEVRDSLASDSSACHRQILRSWIARNDCGKRSVALQTILVKDMQPPVFVDFPQDSVRIACGQALPDETPRALDNSGKRLEVELYSVETTVLGPCDTIITRYWRVVDDCGNDTIRSQILLIQPGPQGLLGPGTPWHCGETYVPDTAISQILRQTLQAEDVIWISGFPVRLLNVNGSAGTFSGNGLLTLPFGEKAVKVSFSGIQVNEDGKVLAGAMQAVRNPKIAPIRCPEHKEVDFCPTYTSLKDSLARELVKQENGFKDCEWQGEPPVPGMEIDRRYDPYGFDCHGQHISGGTVNEMGCTQADMNDHNNSQCFGKATPYAWLSQKDTLGPVTQEGAELAEIVKDSLADLVTGLLAELVETYGQDAGNKRTECAGIRNDMRAVFSSLGIADSAYVFGSNGQYINEGMWRAFSSAPKTLNSTMDRRQEMIRLEQLHVSLYACDQEQEKRQMRYQQVLEWSKEQNQGALVQALNDLIRRLPSDSVQAFSDRDRFLAWLKGQIISRTEQQAATGATQSAGSGQEGSTALRNPVHKGVAVYNQKIKARGTSEPTAPEQGHGWTENFQQHTDTHTDLGTRSLSSIAGNPSGGFVAVPEPAAYSASNPAGSSLDSGAVMLPLTIDNIVEGKSYSIILDNISFDASSGGKLDAFLTLPSPGGKDTLFFQALNVPFTPGGADYTNARLRLACDAPLRLNNIAQLKVLADDQTYVEWNCAGFSRLRIGAEIEFCRNVLVPYDGATLKPLPDSMRLKASLETAITNWDGFTMGLTFSHPFGISEDGGFIFRAEDAYIDMSDTQTPANLQFPENYPFADATSRNLWRGFFMKQFSVYLPQELDKTGAPRGISLNDLIIDDGGVSVTASIPGPIIPLSEGNLDGWAFSIDSVILKILRNQFSGAGFGGLLNIPLLSNPAAGAEITEADCVRYSATIESGRKYNFTVQPASSKRIGMWFADLHLKNSSRVDVTYQDGAFVTKAILNGSIAVNSGDAGLKIKVPELAFEGLTVSNTAPYFDPGVWDNPKSTAGAGADFNGFSLHVDSIRAAGGAQPGLSFRVHMDVGPENGGIAVKGGFKLKGKLDVSTGRQRWLPDGIQVDQFSLRGEVKGIFKVDGFADFFENHAQFGNGFWGGLDAELLLQGLKGAGIKAVALFGATPGPEAVKYFMIDAMGMLPSSTPSIIKGFGGGVWNRMEALDTSIVLSAFQGDLSAFPIGQSLSGIKYTPSGSAGLGLKASLRLSMGEGAFDALVALSGQFQAGGGLGEMRLTGVGTLLKKPGPNGQIDVQNAAIQAGVDLKYSFSARAFDGQLNVRMDIPNAITATGEAKIHFSDKKWFIYAGTPQNPIRALLQIPLGGAAGDSLVSARLYLDMGSELPPVATVPSYFRDMGISPAILSGQGTAAGGVMFGVALDFRMGFKFKPLYASLQAALGADLALIDHGDAICASTGKPLGINGWYASGQIYAYIQASVGLVFKDKPFPVAELSVGAILQGRMPNPVFARGALGGKYKILGGLVKGKFNLQFTIGKDCGEIIPEDGSTPSLEQNYEIIAALVPEDGARNVPTTAVPAAQFRFPINGALDSYDENGNRVIYLVELDGIPTLTDSAGTAIPAALEISSDGNFLKFQPYDAFSPNSRYTFTVKVKYSQNGVLIGGQEKQVSFTTGAEETFIPPANIASSYPVHQMQHFYPGEFSGQQEFIQLIQGQPGLFTSGSAPEAVLSDASGALLWQGPVQYQHHSRRILFDFPNHLLRNGQCYVLEIRRPANAGLRADDNPGQAAASGSLTAISFCVSAFDSFREKAQAFLQAAGPATISDPVLRAAAAEGFDALESGGAFGAQGLVRLEADFWNAQNPAEQWYLQQTAMLYKTYTSQQLAEPFEFAPIARGGAAPATAVYFDGNGSAIRYDVLNEVYTDFEDFLNQLHEYEMNLTSACLPGQEPAYGSSGACANCCLLPEFLPALKNTGLGLPPAGKYPLRLTYTVPGMNGSSSLEPGVWLQTVNPE